MITDSNNSKSFSAKARARRMLSFSQFAESCGLSNAHMLDIGGTINYWKMNAYIVPKKLISTIEIVNLRQAHDSTIEINELKFCSYEGNALDKSTLRQHSYDVVYSNSVIEHVGNLRSQQHMASIIQEIGTYYWIQTPAKSFPIEPHFYFPFFQYLPLSVRTFLHQRIKMGWMHKQKDWLKARMYCEDIRLLSKRELVSIFPGCRIIEERYFGICKSYIATNMSKRAL